MLDGKYGPLLIAEIGGNHQGNFAKALELTNLALESGVDCIKFQIYSGNRLVSSMVDPARNAHFKKFELTMDQHLELAELVTNSGVKYSASVWDIESLKIMSNHLKIVKIGSGDLTAYPIISEITNLAKPIILSTGLANEREVVDCINFIEKANPIYLDSKNLAVLQCTSMYPISSKDANLSVMSRLREITGKRIGYSDHTIGLKALIFAAAMGAEILEFHFTDNKQNSSFRDHLVSLEKDDVCELINELILFRELYGLPEKNPTAIEIETGHVHSFRRGVYPSRSIEAGEVLTEDNLTVLRPIGNIDARDYYNLLGRRAKRSIGFHENFDLDDLM